MILRKLRSISQMAANPHRSYPLFKLDRQGSHNNIPLVLKTHSKYYSLYSFLFLSIWFFLLLFFFPITRTHFTMENNSNSGDYESLSVPLRPASCDIANVSVYVYELPANFNLGLLQDCQHLNVYTDMCPHVANRGLGQPLRHMGQNWFATHQFIGEMIFHARMESHPCRTWEPENATLFYVPFYGGLHASSKFREPDLAVRDKLAIELVEYLTSQQQPWWQRRHGKDHFLALGRTAWDFMRRSEEGAPDFGANCLLNLPQVKNMSVLTVERHPWEGHNQHGIPYPSYFHPSSEGELVMWQEKMKRMERPYLFSFVGAPRTGVDKAAIRDEIIKQCADSSRCKLLKCGREASECHNPSKVMEVMSRSHFCTQAPGDSFTRRSTFDSLLAGCIPVFFSPHTAYSQYAWYLPAERHEYSVYIEGAGNGGNTMKIEKQLLSIPKEKVERMRMRVIELIPSLTYFHPNHTIRAGGVNGGGLGGKLRDAVDVALQHLSAYSSNSHISSTTARALSQDSSVYGSNLR